MSGKGWVPKDAEHRKRQRAIYSRIRYNAEEQLIQNHLDEFNELYREEAAQDGVEIRGIVRKAPVTYPGPPPPPPPETVESLKYQIKLAKRRLVYAKQKQARVGESGG